MQRERFDPRRVMATCLRVRKSTGPDRSSRRSDLRSTQVFNANFSNASRTQLEPLRFGASRMGPWWLLEAQSDEWIDACGAARGDVASQESDGHQKKSDGDVGEGVPDADA